MTENDKGIIEKYDWSWSEVNERHTFYKKDGLRRYTYKKLEFAPKNFVTGELLDIDPATWDMYPFLIDELSTLRMNNGASVVIHRNGGFSVDGHSDHSLHYGWPRSPVHVKFSDIRPNETPSEEMKDFPTCIGLAVDLTVMDRQGKPRPIIDQALMAYKVLPPGFRIGIYPFWNRPGLHIDYAKGTGKSDSVWFKPKEGKHRFFPRSKFYECIEECILHLNEIEEQEAA